MIDQIWFNDRLAIQDIWQVLSRIDFLKVFRFGIFCPLVDLAHLAVVGIIYTYILMAIDSFLPSVGHGWLINSWLTWSIFQALDNVGITLDTAHEHKSYICLLISLAFGTAFLLPNLLSLAIGLEVMLVQIWFNDVDSMLRLAGLFGIGSLAWAGHIVHVANVNHMFGQADSGVGTAILTFFNGVNPVTCSLWMTDIAHHHLAIGIVFIVAGHFHAMGSHVTDLLSSHNMLFINSWHAHLSIIHHPTQLSQFTHHMWIGGFFIVGAAAHAALFMVYDYQLKNKSFIDRVLGHKYWIIVHLNWVCIFLGLSVTLNILGTASNTVFSRNLKLFFILELWLLIAWPWVYSWCQYGCYWLIYSDLQRSSTAIWMILPGIWVAVILMWYQFIGIWFNRPLALLNLQPLQAGTDFDLTFYYRPTVADALESVRSTMIDVHYGWLVQASHRCLEPCQAPNGLDISKLKTNISRGRNVEHLNLWHMHHLDL